jgi:hypothetical protein
MTRRDYIIIAKALRQAREEFPAARKEVGAVSAVGADAAHRGIDTGAELRAIALREDNPRFDGARFMAARGRGHDHANACRQAARDCGACLRRRPLRLSR